MFDFSTFRTSSVYAELHQNQIEDDSQPDPMLVQKSKSPFHLRIGENLNVQGYSQYY